MAETAASYFERQTRYDLLHHAMRLQRLGALASPTSFQRELIRRSRHVLANPCEGYRSVSLSNTAYLAELDAFAAARAA